MSTIASIPVKYQVHKIGGSCLRDAADMARIPQVLLSATANTPEQVIIIVVSALYEITDLLQSALDAAQNGTDSQAYLSTITTRHYTLSKTLLATHACDAFMLEFRDDLAKITAVLTTVALLHNATPSSQDFVLGFGELWSSKLLHRYLSSRQNIEWLDVSKILLVTKDAKQEIIVDWEHSQQALQQFLATHKTPTNLIVPGFIATNAKGQRITLGRNGSDFSAAIIATLVAATELYFWKNVAGIFTADPKRVTLAFPIPELSYEEAIELAYFGAQVLHPKAIAPVIALQIPIRIKNIFAPDQPGTLVTATKTSTKYPIKGLTCIDDVTLINVNGAGMLGVSGIATKVFACLSQNNISVILISQSSSECSICFAIRAKDHPAAMIALQQGLVDEVGSRYALNLHCVFDCAVLSAVGDGMIGTPGIAAKFFGALAKAHINILAIAQGSSERNISVVVHREVINKALSVAHAGFYLSNKTIAIGLIGTGKIGKALLRQIDKQLRSLQQEQQVNICVLALSNSREMLLSQQAISLSHWQEILAQKGEPAHLDRFVTHLANSEFPHAVIIDCTASERVAVQHLAFLQRGLHVITANKHGNAGDWQYYQAIRAAMQQYNRHYLYETNVCAGLPVINTLQDLLKTGDEITALTAVVSGTLSFIFNQLAKGQLFSTAVKLAKQKGYTEPDPREDLSGNDIGRKMVCLARELKLSVSMSDLKIESLVPNELTNCDADEFLARLPAYDEAMHIRIEAAKHQNARCVYVGHIDAQGSVSVQLQNIANHLPLANLTGTDNMLMFTTTRYCEQPLVIRGPGAGVEVTAGGIFADLLRLVSFISS